MAKTMKHTEAIFGVLAAAYLDRHPEAIARKLENVKPAATAALLAAEPVERARGILRRLTPVVAVEVLLCMDAAKSVRLLADLEPNRVAALLAGMSHQDREERLIHFEPEAAKEVNELMAYPPNSAGYIMDPRATTFRDDATVRDVVLRLRTIRARRVQDIFLVDEEDHLTGTVAIQDVLLAPRDTLLASLVSTEFPSLTPFAQREEVLEVLDRFRARSLPVVDFEGRILGVIRQEAIVTATAAAATADMVAMVGASKDERALSSPFFAVRKRLPWLQVNLLTAFLAASVVGLFEGTIARFTALAVLLPVVAGQSGNTGAQALAVTMRGLALREIRARQWFRVTAKEATAALINGVAVAFTTAVAVYFWSRSKGLALVIFVSMILSMTAAGISGAIIPILLTRLRQDPAQSSSIILTTVTDVVGFLSFLGIATALSSML